MNDEALLVERLRAGDEGAFATLVREYHRPLLRVASSVVGSPSVAAEVVQDTWLAVVRGLERFEGRSTLKTWLFHILLNRARTTAMRERRSDTVDVDALADRFDGDGAWDVAPEPWSERVDDRIVAEHLAPKVHALIEALPANLRRVVLLRDVEGLSAAEVSSLLGISDGNQRVLLHRARARVRSGLEAELETA